MDVPFCRRARVCLLLLVLWVPSPTHGAGLYLNLPWWFAPRDTLRCSVLAGQTHVAAAHDDATLLSLEFHIRTDSRSRIRAGFLYPVIRRPGQFVHGLADLFVGTEWQVAGDSTQRSGVYLRTDVRVPTGSESMWPYAWESLDGGAGIELRRAFDAIDLSLSAAGTLAGRRVRAAERGHENNALVAAAVGIEPGSGISLRFAAFGQFFRGGGYREAYLLDLGLHPADRLELRLCGGLDSGRERDRVFDSLVQFYLIFRFPPPLPPAVPVDD